MSNCKTKTLLCKKKCKGKRITFGPEGKTVSNKNFYISAAKCVHYAEEKQINCGLCTSLNSKPCTNKCCNCPK